jgi:hypothetical protein
MTTQHLTMTGTSGCEATMPPRQLQYHHKFEGLLTASKMGGQRGVALYLDAYTYSTSLNATNIMLQGTKRAKRKHKRRSKPLAYHQLLCTYHFRFQNCSLSIEH